MKLPIAPIQERLTHWGYPPLLENVRLVADELSSYHREDYGTDYDALDDAIEELRGRRRLKKQ